MTPAGDDETLDDDEPQLDTVMIQHPGAVNRIKVSIPYMDIDHTAFILWPSLSPQVAPLTEHRLVATWSEKGVVHIWNADKHVLLLDRPSVGGSSSGKTITGHKEAPLFSFSGHQVTQHHMMSHDITSYDFILHVVPDRGLCLGLVFYSPWSPSNGRLQQKHSLVVTHTRRLLEGGPATMLRPHQVCGRYPVES